MKKLILILFLITGTGTAYGNTLGKDGGPISDQGTTIGGIGADGKFHILLLANDGSLPGAGTLVSSAAYEASRVIKASAGTLIFISGYNSKVSAQFIQLFNSTTVPADTAVPVYTMTVAASSNFSFFVPTTGMPFSTGIAISNSSTGPTKTVGSADCFFTAVFK